MIPPDYIAIAGLILCAAIALFISRASAEKNRSSA